jgi:hypothetical protein
MTNLDDIFRSLSRGRAELDSAWRNTSLVWRDDVARAFAQEIVLPLGLAMAELQAAVQSVSQAIDEFHERPR